MRLLRLLVPLPEGCVGTGIGTEGMIRGEGFTTEGGVLSITGMRSGMLSVTGGCLATGLLASVMVTDMRFSRGRSCRNVEAIDGVVVG